MFSINYISTYRFQAAKSVISVRSLDQSYNSILSSHDPDFPVAPPCQPSDELNPLRTKLRMS